MSISAGALLPGNTEPKNGRGIFASMVGMKRVCIEPAVGATVADSLVADEALSRLARQRAFADAEEGRWLLVAQRTGAHVHRGFGSFFEYVERMFGYRPRSIRDKLRVAEALERLPALALALEKGRLTWCAVRELTRVAVPETASIWLDLAVGKSLRELEEAVAGKRLGDLPSALPDPCVQRHALSFEVSPETFALLREAFAELRRRSDSALNDDAALLEMARCVLAGPADDGRSSYQIALNVCPQCSVARLNANGKLVPVDPEVVEKAECDAQHLAPIEPDSRALPTPPAAHVGHVSHGSHRAKQDIPPATRRAVIRRDHHRCRVPGCKNAIYVDVHHLQLRSKGGSHQASNLITVCSAHHSALHHGRLRTEGNADAVGFLHADGRAYGQPSAHVVDVATKVAAGLRGLGFREGEVRSAMAELRQREDLAEATAEQWLREALQRLHRPQRHGRAF